MKLKVLVVSGLSGGHIFPAISFLDTLKEQHKDIETLLILPKISLHLPRVMDIQDVRYVSISRIKLGLDLKNLFAILKFFKGSIESLILLIKFHPDVVVGFGSLVSLPVILSAWMLRMKTLIHEQNLIPGRANRFLARFTDKIAISFGATRDYLNNHKAKIVFTGNPLRGQLKKITKFQAHEFFGFSPDKFTILVMGGSAGSHSINIGFLNALSGLTSKSKLQVIHLSGLKDYDILNQGYKKLNINYKLFGFLDDMQYAYSAADLVVSRAGAISISEIMFFELPTVIIPYPYAYAHQLKNARVLEENGCATIIPDNQLDTGILIRVIEDFINNPGKISLMRSGYNNMLKVNAGDLLVNEVLSLVRI